MTEYMNQFAALFDEPSRAAALTLAALAFVLGAIASCAFCKVACRCGSQSSRQRRPQGRAPRFEKRHPAPADGSVELYVGNLDYEMTEAQLRAEFEKYGAVNSVRIITNRYTNRSKGFGFVQMPVRSEAEAAVKGMDGREMAGRRIKCNEAKNLV